MDGISLAELRQRHAECMEARATLQRLFHDQDTGFAYVLGELEQMIKRVEGRQQERDMQNVRDMEAP